MEDIDDLEPAAVGQKVTERYEVLARIGEGGMGIVYLANDDRADRKVVLKFPKKEILYKRGFRSRFGQEVKSLIRFEHPHVVRVYDVGTHEGMPFMVLQYLDGGTLAERIARQGAQAGGELVGALHKVAGVLDALHAGGTIHRDVKAANILFDSYGEPHISDFGIAKVVIELDKQGTGTEPGAAIGSPESLAPEHIHGTYTPAYDQYGLATVAYQALAGRLPFEGSTGYELQYKIIQEAPTPLTQVAPHVSAAASDVVMRGLAKNPQDRFGSCRAFVVALEQAFRSADRPAPAADLGVMTSPPPAPKAAPPPPPASKATPPPVTPRSAPAPQPAPAPAPASEPPPAMNPLPLTARAWEAEPVRPRPAESVAAEPSSGGWRTVVNHWLFWIVTAALAAATVVLAVFFPIDPPPASFFQGWFVSQFSAEAIAISSMAFCGAHLLLGLRSSWLTSFRRKLQWGLAPLVLSLSTWLLPLAEPTDGFFADGTLLVDWWLRLPIVVGCFLACVVLTLTLQAGALKDQLLAWPKPGAALVYTSAYLVIMIPAIVLGPSLEISWAMLTGVALLVLLFRKVMPLLVDRAELEQQVGQSVAYPAVRWWPDVLNRQVLAGASGWWMLVLVILLLVEPAGLFAEQPVGPLGSGELSLEGLAVTGFLLLAACIGFGLVFRRSVLGGHWIFSLLGYLTGGALVSAVLGTQSLVPLPSEHSALWVIAIGVIGGLLAWTATWMGAEPQPPLVQPGPRWLTFLRVGFPVLAVIVCLLLAPGLQNRFFTLLGPSLGDFSIDSASSLEAAAAAPEAAAPAIDAPTGQEFLIETLREGGGDPVISGESVTVHYTGWLFDAGSIDLKGTEFDSSRTREPFTTEIGKGFLIEGWEKGILGMRVGEIRRLIVPASMAYGAQGSGTAIPPHAALIFEVELLGIKAPSVAAEAPAP